MALTELTRDLLTQTAVHFVRLALVTPAVLYVAWDWGVWRYPVWALLGVYWLVWLALAISAVSSCVIDPVRRER